MIDWLSFKHHMLVHFPVAAALLAPLALLAAQRAGRGIRPWWTAARFLILAGSIVGLFAVFTGLAMARKTALIPPGGWLVPGNPVSGSLNWIARRHQFLALASVAVGWVALKAAHRQRKDHQGIGILALLAGLLWAGLTGAAGYYGGQLAHAGPSQDTEGQKAAEPPPPPPDPEAEAPLRALDYLRLEPMHLEPVKSPPHGNRWIRVWVTPAAAEAYAAGKALPPGSLAVMSSTEDRWGRPGFDAGPLYVMETRGDGKPSFTLYWARVPEAKRGETGGAERVYWRGADPALGSCQACHASGIAPVRDRSQWRVPRRPKAETEESPAPDGGGNG
ncbi:MAG: hypothetical protein HY823_08475 [Acidobacteria bacterium]|nr:hypothetical protein [Acidobacteriota bacterium]